MTLGPRLARVAWVTAVAGGLAAILLRLVMPVPHVENSFGLADAAMSAFVILGIVFASVGALLIIRGAGNGIGWYLIAIGWGYGLSMLTSYLTSLAVASGGTSDPAAGIAGWFTAGLSTIGGLTFVFLAFVFPTGRPQSATWHRARRLLLVASVAPWVAIVLLGPGSLHLFPTINNPFAVGPDIRGFIGDRLMTEVTALGTVMLALLATAAVVARYRAAGGIERQQLKWFISAVSVSGASLGFTGLVGLADAGARPELPITIYAVAGITVPLAIGIAILRYRLYDIDRLISRTIAYAGISAALLAVYGGSILLLQSPLTAVTGGENLGVALSTLAAATLFQPIRGRVQAAVDRRFHRARYDAERTAAAFADRVRNEVDLSTLAAELDRTVRVAMEPASLALWLRERGR